MEETDGRMKSDELASSFGIDFEPTVGIDETSATVTIPYVDGSIVFGFADIETKAKSFDAEVTVQVYATEGRYEPFVGHLQAVSLSNRETFRRMLDNEFGKEFDWAKRLNKAIAMARTAYFAAGQSQHIVDVEPSTSRYAIEGFVPDSGVTIVFGMGNSAKTYLTLDACLSTVNGMTWIDRFTVAAPVLYLDYEARASTIRRRWERLANGCQIEGLHYMHGRGVAVVDQQDAIRREIDRTKAGLVVVDSAVMACGGNPSDAEPVKAMFNAMNRIGVPVILIAHTDKAENDKYPFGSIFWHNGARMTWNVKRIDSEESPDIQVGFHNRKANDDRKQRSFGVMVRFTDPDGAVEVASMDLTVVPELRYTTSQKLIGAIRDSGTALGIEDLAPIVPTVSRHTVYNTLGLLVKDGRLGTNTESGEGKKWALLSS